MKRCVIISGGDFSPSAEISADDYVIACDRGYEHALRMGITPNLVIGDFDSYSGALPTELATVKLPCEKDDTDTMYAVKYAIEHGFKELLLICALGGRFDHAFANIQSCVYAIEHGAAISVWDDSTDIRFLRGGSLTLPKKENRSISLFSLSPRCTGVCVSGVKYPLHEAELTYCFPLGVSNDWTDNEATVCVAQGILMVVMSEKRV